MIAKPHVQESTHWYTKDGKPMYTVPDAKGQPRAATLRDARKLDLVPSVTSIIKVAASPALEIWKQKQVLMAALTLPRREGEPEDAWIERIMQDSKEEGRKAADAGTQMHADIQGYFEGDHSLIRHQHVQATLDAITGATNRFHFDCELSFSHDVGGLGYGGKIDLISTDRHVLLDVKTKEFSDPSKPLHYDEHAIQLAAYKKGIAFADTRCYNVFVSRSTPGLVVIKEWTNDEIERGFRMFSALLSYWYETKQL